MVIQTHVGDPYLHKLYDDKLDVSLYPDVYNTDAAKSRLGLLRIEVRRVKGEG